MNCPNCGTWNPEDKDVCWRCQTRLPSVPTEKKKKATLYWGLPLWTWALLIVLFILTPMFSQCIFLPPT